MTDELNGMMRVVVKDQPQQGLTLTTKPIPSELQPDEVLIRVTYTSICGTDHHIYEYDDWAKKRLKLPFTAGHEFCGEVVKIGTEVTRVKLGDIVSAETHIICGECQFCKSDNGHICENTKIIGVDTDGAFAEYVRIPAMNCFVNSPDKNPLHLSVQEPLGNAVHTMAHFPVEGKDVVIVGCGPIGLMGVNVAKAYKATKIIAVEVNEYRLGLAKKLGADVVINPLKEDVIQRVLEETEGRGVDVIGEFSGNKTAIEQSFKYLKRGGGLSMLGIPSKDIDVDVANDIVFKGIQIYGVVGRRIYETWHQVKELIDNDMLDLDTLITHTYPMSKIEEAMEIMGSGNCGKIIVDPRK
ncbi:L-threonine 3-dehydrogenase [Candidatus Xianfuyuplasma coldseepsis]|uniref:L-threonine 3-dehydrogenase n=1 Tax=Candidatus Xianfuyuplasma coldseepsis TaxID=2782163 RepID=A0A7L7KU18_9MOLU|nr:L-threonine 3-dehydrogenase [Xianfuyuplasma coldseepsis]QMS85504.1 L-threonine 3-dehydrogenase [Xianfuyuplasma coldseepsis]